MFYEFNLDYLTVRTHTPYHSAYNPVEHGMATLSQKLAGIVLPIDKYGIHLNSQGEVINQELAKKNFQYAGETLYNLWNWDPIFGNSVITHYIDQHTSSFNNVTFPEYDTNNIVKSTIPWKWLENHTKMCQYSLDIKKCDNISCCMPKCCKDATNLLALNNGFLPPLVKENDKHYLNLIYTLEFYDINKLPGYDMHCPFLTNYKKLCCSICDTYFPTSSMVTLHVKSQHPR
ncbi:22957_t:CDS:1 [Cetraspora pellucida]|uniref:22957_t:CDS:1 n=1 Tax=Cetraspora pellucida TaxID=1433469 RepID=A0A9N9DS42_9GLOM|nr:22957_t:CDS:1 [Cetraspora pellucida]